MKSRIQLFLTTLVTLLVASALPATASAATVNVKFDDPENFSDLEQDGFYSPALLERFESAVREVLKNEAAEALPEDGQLTIIFRDVDLAGEYEPWRINTQDVRIMRDIYPPRLKFEYRVRNASDEILAQGTAQLYDMNYLWNIPQSLWRSSTFYHEKQLLEDWASVKLPMLVQNREGVASQ